MIFVFDRPLVALARIAGVVSLLAVAPLAVAAEPVGEVAALTGQASATNAGGARDLHVDDPLHIAELVATGEGARAVLALGERTTLRLGGQTEVRLDRYVVDAGGELTLGAGAILFDRDGPPGNEPLSINSEYGLILVRGTTFFAGPSRGVFGVFVESGAVSVTGGGTTVVVNAGEGTNIEAPGATPSEPTEWGAGRIEEALRSVR